MDCRSDVRRARGRGRGTLVVTTEAKKIAPGARAYKQASYGLSLRVRQPSLPGG